ncbi:hypothetical protein FB451DRAFT_1074388 [Mycena latifolia]|nr:hypothetical protein FB451DRAFT_1074388 [Mycena latifolia]
MAEILGTLTSIVQLVDTALKARDYIQDFRHAPEEQQKLLAGMDDLRPLLVELQKRLVEKPSNGSLQQMKPPLTTFQATMEHFSATLRPADGRMSKMSKRLMWSMGDKQEAKEYLLKFEQFKSLLNSWLLLDIWDANQQQRRDHEDIRDVMDDIASQQQLGRDLILSSVADAANHQRLQIDSKERAKIIAWLSPLNFFLRQADITRVRQTGTGEWFLADQRFQEWESSAGGTLWCRGIPGAGKTVLASVVVEHLSIKSEDQNLGVASIYLNHKEAESLAHLLASIWRQLVLGKSIGSAAQRAYQQHSEKGTKPSLDEIDQILRSAMTEWSKVYVVVDALDEYPEEERHVLLEHLAALRPKVNLMLNSRPHISLGQSFPNFTTIQIRANEQDLEKYLTEQIRIAPRLSAHINARPELRLEIVSGIITRADGMFLLAKLHIESLRKKPTIRALREALQNLPTDLEETYDDAMKRIEDQDDEDAKIAHSVLTWIANAKRLLKIRELQEALAVQPGASRFDPDDLLDIEIILSVCAGLVITDGHRRVRLVHYTTQHYLDSIQARRFPDAQTHITRTLLTVLAFDGESQAPSLRFDYCQFCLVHAVGEPEADLRDMIAKFLGQSSTFSALRPGSGTPPWTYPDWPAYVSPLWIAAGANLVETATNLINAMPGNLNDTDCSPLHVATFYGHLEMVRLLTEKGALIDAQDRKSRSALHIASEKGRENIARLLIQKGANLNAQDGEHRTALHIALHKRHENIIRLLLEMEADINAQGGRYGNPLQAASLNGLEAAVRLLIEKGADVNAPIGEFPSALHVASYQGYENIVRLLIEKGADVNGRSERYGTALQAALSKGHEDAIDLLIEKGADRSLCSLAVRRIWRRNWTTLISTPRERYVGR